MTYSEVSDYTGQTIPINQTDTGTLGGDTTSYLIESIRSGSVLRVRKVVLNQVVLHN